MIWCSSEPQGPRLFTPRSTGRENKAIVPRSKVKTGYYSGDSSLSLVVESDPSLLLTQSVSASGFASVAGRWCATDHSRAWGPTSDICGVQPFVHYALNKTGYYGDIANSGNVWSSLTYTCHTCTDTFLALEFWSYVCLIREQQGDGYHGQNFHPTFILYHVAPVMNQTLAGNFTANEEVKLHNILLPEFHKTRRLQTLMAKIFDNRCHYDMILGLNLMNHLGIMLDFNNKSMAWDGSTVAMCGYDQNQEPTTLATNLLLDVLDSNLEANDSIILLDKPSDMNYQEKDVDPSRYKTKTIHTSLYEPSNLQDIVDRCVYLLPSQHEQLYSLLTQFQQLFDRHLKSFKVPLVHLELIENPVLVRWRPYTIPTSCSAVLKEELSHLISIGVIKKAQCSKWIARTFIVPKKDGHVQWITDL